MQNAGLGSVCTLPYGSDNRIRLLLNRPKDEKVLMLLSIGYPSNDATVPELKRKPLEEIIKCYL